MGRLISVDVSVTVWVSVRGGVDVTVVVVVVVVVSLPLVKALMAIPPITSAGNNIQTALFDDDVVLDPEGGLGTG